MKRTKVLLVDDDPNFVESIRTVLEANDYNIAVAHSGKDCLKTAKGEKPDLIILDVMLPDIDGFTVCHELKKEDLLSDIPILILTSISAKPKGSGKVPADIAARHKADGYAEKPISPQGLLEKVRTLLSEKKVLHPTSPSRSKEPKVEEKTAKILVADDDPDFVGAIKPILEENNYEIMVATSGEECLEKAEKEPPDLILLDVIFPGGLDGFTVCRQLKENAQTRSIPVVMLTSVGKEFREPEYAQEIAITHLVDDYLDKPVEPQELLRKIHKNLRL